MEKFVYITLGCEEFHPILKKGDRITVTTVRDNDYVEHLPREEKHLRKLYHYSFKVKKLHKKDDFWRRMSRKLAINIILSTIVFIAFIMLMVYIFTE